MAHRPGVLIIVENLPVPLDRRGRLGFVPEHAAAPADHVVTISEAPRRIAVERGGGTPPDVTPVRFDLTGDSATAGLLDDPDRRRMGATGRGWVERLFDWRWQVRGYLPVYDAVPAGRRLRHAEAVKRGKG